MATRMNETYSTEIDTFTCIMIKNSIEFSESMIMEITKFVYHRY